jgi:heme exporter protein A
LIPPEPAVDARGLERWFGPLPAVRGIDVVLAPGEMLTVFGPNGAGKSTLLRMLCGSLRPSSGSVRIAGTTVGGADGGWKRKVGLLSHQTFLYPGLTATENLEFFARLYALDRPREAAEAGIVRAGLWDRRGDRVRTLSRGMQQRLALARTLLHEPEVVFLDEPYTGLDPHAASILRGVLERLRDGRRSVMLVTHNLSQGLELSDRVVVQVGGRWVSDEPRGAVDPGSWEQVYTGRVAAALGA